MPLTLVASGKNVHFTVVVRIRPLQTAKKLMGVTQLPLPCGSVPVTMQAPFIEMSICHSQGTPSNIWKNIPLQIAKQIIGVM